MTQADFLSQLRTIALALPIGGAATLPRDFLVAGVEADAVQSVALRSSTTTDIADNLLTAREAAALLSVAPATLYKPAWQRRYAVRVGSRSLRFSRSKIEIAIRRGAVR
jgi:predicted DNA-binding transcriptional regulator AlpA